MSTLRQNELFWINTRKEFIIGLMKRYCKKYDITDWKIKFIDVKKVYDFDADAFVDTSKKTMFINTDNLGKKVPPYFFTDVFLHEFAHILEFEFRFERICVGLYEYRSFFSKHGRTFRKLARDLGVDERCIPTYNNNYQSA